MFAHLKNNAVPMMIGVSFCVFGFLVMADALDLSGREIVVGLIAGAVGGVTIMMAMLWQERKTNRASDPTAAAAP